jgi:hypothetical protein
VPSAGPLRPAGGHDAIGARLICASPRIDPPIAVFFSVRVIAHRTRFSARYTQEPDVVHDQASTPAEASARPITAASTAARSSPFHHDRQPVQRSSIAAANSGSALLYAVHAGRRISCSVMSLSALEQYTLPPAAWWVICGQHRLPMPVRAPIANQHGASPPPIGRVTAACLDPALHQRSRTSSIWSISTKAPRSAPAASSRIPYAASQLVGVYHITLSPPTHHAPS